MISIGNTRRIAIASIIMAAFGVGAVSVQPAFAQSSEIRYVVNNQVVTNNDIQRRAAFLRLQQRSGNLQQEAGEEMVDQMLRMREAQRLNISISDSEVDDSYQRFAASNNISTGQLDQMLAQSGVTRNHFRDYIRAQMSWGRALQARMRAENEGDERAAVERMLDHEGERPSATEYMLQQVIFVVPEAERSARLGERRREAEAMRQRFTGCDTTREFATGLIDVTVRDLGRVLEPELPPDWESHITSTSAGNATAVRDTERGVEFIGICSAREVSDDRVAQMVLETEAGGESMQELSEKYTGELREAAQIVQR